MANREIEKVDFKEDIEPVEESIFLKVEPVKKDPTMMDPDWENFVLSQFDKSELIKGRPKVPGLRRVVRKLIGPITSIIATPLQYPTLENGQRCTATCTVTVFVTEGLKYNEIPYEISFCDGSDAWHENITGIEFMRYPVAMACTRAEGRALRKILNLATPAAEEVSDQPVDIDSLNGTINERQITRLDIKCEQLDVDVLKFVNGGKKKYKDIKDIPHTTAVKMLNVLVEHERKNDVPEELLGYNANWRD